MKDLLTSRKFWAAVFVLLVTVVSAISPNFDLDTEHAAGLAVIAASYLIGVAVDPGPGGWKGVLQSRKFWSAAIGLAIVIMDGFGILLPLGFSEEQLILIAVTFGGYIAGVAFEQKFIE
jgi:hypothetical protein